MRSDSFESIFRRDLDQLPTLKDDEWVPREAGSTQRVTAGGTLVFMGLVLSAIFVGFSLQAVRDAELSRKEAASTDAPYFVVAGQGVAAASTPNVLAGAPVCSSAQIPEIDVAHPPPPGDPPGSGAPSAEEAFRRTFPALTNFKIYPFEQRQPFGPYWIVSQGKTYVAEYLGGPGQNSWFAYPAKFVGCHAPQPNAASPTASPAQTWMVGPPISNGLSGAPMCSPGQSPILDGAGGGQPGTGSDTPQAAFRRSFPNVSDFKMYPFGPGENAPVWIVVDSNTYVVSYVGDPGQNSWFAHPAKYVGCYTPEPRTPPPGGRPPAVPTTFG
jgi:hypothetical protein